MKKLNLFFTIIVLLLFSTVVIGQGLPGSDDSGESDRIEGKFKFIPLPIVDYGNAEGLTLGALPIGMFNLSEKDTISPSSSAGLLGTYSQNKTWYLIGFGMFYLNEDRWRITVAGGLGDENSQYFAASPINRWVRYNTGVDFAFVGVQRKIIPHLFGGLRYIYASFKTNSDYYTDSTATQLHGIGFDLR